MEIMRTALFKLGIILCSLLCVMSGFAQSPSETEFEYIVDGSFDQVHSEFVSHPHPHTAFSHTSFGPIWHTNQGIRAKAVPHFAHGRFLTVYISDKYESTAKRQGFYIRLAKAIEPNSGIYQLEFDMASLIGANPPTLVVNRMYQPAVITSAYSRRIEGQHVVIRIDTDIEGFTEMDHLVFTNGGAVSGAFQKVAFDNFSLKKLPDYSMQKRAEEVITIKRKGKKKKPTVIDIFRDKQY